jgi:hypothetical protein
VRSNAEIVKDHMDALFAGDLDGLMRDYADDAVLIAGPEPLRGTESIRAAMAQFDPERFGSCTIDVSVGDGPYHFLAWHTDAIALGSDTFHIVDEKIVLQTFCSVPR